MEEENGGRSRGGSRTEREAERDLIGLEGVQWSPPRQGGKENVPFSL